MGRVKNALYARMEEMSFRSGAALAGGVLAAAAVVIVLAITLSGHSAAETGAAATGAQGPGMAARQAPSPTRPPAASSATGRPASSPAVPAASLAPVDASQPSAPAPAAAPSRPTAWPVVEPDGARWHHRFWRAHPHRRWHGWG